MLRPGMLSIAALVGALACTDEAGQGSSSGSSAAAEPPRSPTEPSTPEAPMPGDLAILAGDAALYTAAGADAARVSWALNADERYAFEVIGGRGEFVALRTMSPRRDKQRTCARVPDLGNYYELELFVRRSALSEVLIEPVTLTFDDGARLAFAPGVPVTRSGGEGEGELEIEALAFSATLEPSRVGRWLPKSWAKRQPAKARDWVEHGHVLHYGGKALTGMGEHRPLGLPIAAEPREGGGRSVIFQGACGRFELFEPAHAEPERPPELRERLGGALSLAPAGDTPEPPAGGALVIDCEERWLVPAGTELSWPSGGAAGRARRPHPLPADAEPRGERHCLTREGVALCVPVAELERQDASGQCAK